MGLLQASTPTPTAASAWLKEHTLSLDAALQDLTHDDFIHYVKSAMPTPALPDSLPPLKPALIPTAVPLKLAVFCTSVTFRLPPVVKRLLPLLTAWLVLAMTPPVRVVLLATLT